MSRALEELARHGDRLSISRRVGQALWMQIGMRLEQSSLLWARGIFGSDGDDLLWRGLAEEGVIGQGHAEIDPAALAAFLCALAGTDLHKEPSLVWSIPPGLRLLNPVKNYAEATVELIAGARQDVVLVSPFLEARGVGRILASSVDALDRGVSFMVITHEAEDLSSLASQSLQELQREAIRRRGRLAVVSSATNAGALLHCKIVLIDEEQVLIGSANVTRRGLGENLEAGVVLGTRQAIEVAKVIEALLTSQLVTPIFDNRSRL